MKELISDNTVYLTLFSDFNLLIAIKGRAIMCIKSCLPFFPDWKLTKTDDMSGTVYTVFSRKVYCTVHGSFISWEKQVSRLMCHKVAIS